MAERYSNQQKAAAVMILLGSERAAHVYKYLSDTEVEQLTYEIARASSLSAEDLDDILTEFYGICLAQQVVSEGGLNYARDVLEKAFGAQTADQLLEKVSKSLQTKAFDFVRRADYKNLMAIIQNEHPQIIALILSYARTEQAATIIAELPDAVKLDVVERIAKMERTSPDMVKLVERTLENKFTSIMSSGFTELGGLEYIAEIINTMDRGSEKYIFDELRKKDPVLTDEIRKLMFVFEDIAGLDAMDIQRAMRDVDPKDLTLALKGSTPEMQEVFYSNMSKRMAESIQSDMEYLRGVRVRDVNEAQQKIVAIFRKLEEEGEINISKGGKDDMLV